MAVGIPLKGCNCRGYYKHSYTLSLVKGGSCKHCAQFLTNTLVGDVIHFPEWLNGLWYSDYHLCQLAVLETALQSWQEEDFFISQQEVLARGARVLANSAPGWSTQGTEERGIGTLAVWPLTPKLTQLGYWVEGSHPQASLAGYYAERGKSTACNWILFLYFPLSPL